MVDLWAGADLRAGAIELEPTSLFGTIDAEVVHRLIRQRLGKVARLVLRDLLESALSGRHSRAAEDLVETVAGLVLTDSDSATRSQRVLAAVVRLGATYAFYALVQKTWFANHGCQTDQVSAIYEGLAGSTFLGRVGFPAATGKVEGEGCAKLAAEIARTADTVAAIGLQLRSVPELVRGARQVVRACRSDELPVPPLLAAFVAELDALRGNFWRMPIATLKKAREATERYTARLEAEKLDAILPGHGPCLLAMQTLTARAEASVANLMRLLPEGDDTVTLQAVQDQILSVLNNFDHPVLKRVRGWLDAYEHLRKGKLDALIAGKAELQAAWKLIADARGVYREKRADLQGDLDALIERGFEVRAEVRRLRKEIEGLDPKTDRKKIEDLEKSINALAKEVADLAAALKLQPLDDAMAALDRAWKGLTDSDDARRAVAAFARVNRYLDAGAVAMQAVQAPGDLIEDLIASAEAWAGAMTCVRQAVPALPPSITLEQACPAGSSCSAECAQEIGLARAAGLLRFEAVTNEVARIAIDARDLGRCVESHGGHLRASLVELAGKGTCSTGMCEVCSAEIARVKTSLAATGLGQELLEAMVWLGTAQSALLARYPQLALVRSVAAALVSKQKLSAKEVTELARALIAGVEAMKLPDKPRRLLVDVLEAVPHAIKEDDKAAVGVRFDTRALTTTMLERFADDQSEGFYLRASVGAGYVSKAFNDGGTLDPAVYEELGVGKRYRCMEWKRCLWGWHIVTSGLLLSFVPNDDAGDHVFAGVGLSLNAYRLIELSANVGVLRELGGSNYGGVLVSLQLPLLDYFNELTTGDVSPPSETKP